MERADLSALSDRADQGVIETVNGTRYVLEGPPLQTICSDCADVTKETLEGGREGESGRRGGGGGGGVGGGGGQRQVRGGAQLYRIKGEAGQEWRSMRTNVGTYNL